MKALVLAVAYLDYKQKVALIFNQELSCCSSNSFKLMFRDRDNCDWKAQTRISISHGDVKYSLLARMVYKYDLQTPSLGRDWPWKNRHHSQVQRCTGKWRFGSFRVSLAPIRNTFLPDWLVPEAWKNLGLNYALLLGNCLCSPYAGSQF